MSMLICKECKFPIDECQCGYEVDTIENCKVCNEPLTVEDTTDVHEWCSQL